MGNNNQTLFEILRKKRNELAKQLNVKPFMILHNKVLEEIAKKKPATLRQLAKVKGMGPKRMVKYGNFILETINDLSPTTLMTAEEKVFSVSEYIDFLNRILIPQRAIVQGEVGRVDNRASYTFFTLLDKNEEAVLNCFVWQSNLENFGVKLKEGLEIKIEGFPKVFKRKGSFSFEIERLGLVGEGVLKLAFGALKKKLAVAGFFAPKRKKQIPPYVEKIGLITSAFADAKDDFLTHLGKFGFKIYFYDVRVEGLYAIDDIVWAIRWFNENMLDIEVLVLTRGGGSLESLQAFNSEAVAKAIFGSKIPVITGIGHENDETIADLVADFYASTPTHAARVLSDSWRKAEFLVSTYRKNIISIFATSCDNIKMRLNFWERFFIAEVRKSLVLENKRLDYLQTRLNVLFQTAFERAKNVERAFLNNLEKLRGQILVRRLDINNRENIFWQEAKHWLMALNTRLFEYEQRLKLADPTFRLKQGYSIVFNVANKVIKTTRQIRVGESLNLKFYQGRAASRVEKINP